MNCSPTPTNYHHITDNNTPQYVALISSYPLAPAPGVFGLHATAAAAHQRAESAAMLAALLALQPSAAPAPTAAVADGGGAAADDVRLSAAAAREAAVLTAADDVERRLPPRFDLEAIEAAHAPPPKGGSGSNSSNSSTESGDSGDGGGRDSGGSSSTEAAADPLVGALLQECRHHDALLAAVAASLADLRAALAGRAPMGPELEAVARALFDNRVPAAWAARAWPSLKPLSAWVADVAARGAFVRGWAERGAPAVFWLPALRFPQALLAGVLQRFARRYGHPIDAVEFGHEVMDAPPAAGAGSGGSSSGSGNDGGSGSDEDYSSWPHPDEGCLVRGLFLEGARWDAARGALAEAAPGEAFAPLPVVWLRPRLAAAGGDGATAEAAAEAAAADAGQPQPPPPLPVEQGGRFYECPLYRTAARADFVTSIALPAGAATPEHWAMRGAALVASLPF